MNKQITFAQYRRGDLILLAVILAICQFAISWAASRLFPDQLYIVSPAAAVTALVMMRWGLYGAIHAVLGGVFLCLFSSGTPAHYLIYGAGNLLCVPALLFFRALGKEKIRKDSFLSLTFGVTVQVLMLLGRAGMAAVMGRNFSECLGFITTDALSILFTMLIVWAARRCDGLFEDQKTYLLRIQSETNNEGRG